MLRPWGVSQHAGRKADGQTVRHSACLLPLRNLQPYKTAVIPCSPDPTPNPSPSCWVKHHLTVWLNVGNPGKLIALLPPLVLNDPAASCGVYSPWAGC